MALWQANFVAGLLRPHTETVLVEVRTAGDAVRDSPLAEIGGEGLFTREIQQALLDRRVDVAVHSLKDLPTQHASGLTLAAVPRRGPTGDALVSPDHCGLDELPAGAVVATSSLRRRSQILHRRPDLRLVPIRGNVETRLQKLRVQGLDALVLAQAGLERLGLGHVITAILDPDWMLPAVGQGALGLECRADDENSLGLLRPLHDPASGAAVEAERAFLRALGGGCQVPIGALATVCEGSLRLRGSVLHPDGKKRIDGEVTGPANASRQLGEQLAEQLLNRGARDLLSARQGDLAVEQPVQNGQPD